MPPSRIRVRLPRALSLVLAAALAMPLAATGASIEPLTDEQAANPAVRNAVFKQVQITSLRERFASKLAQRRKNAKIYQRALRKGVPMSAGLVRKPYTGMPEAGEPPLAFSRSAERASAAGPSAVTSIPGNIPVNDPTLDLAGVCNSEEAVASWGQYVMAAWNDGGSGSGQGIGYSTNGGLSFTDAGDPPAIPGGGTWFSDPVVTVNENTGEFWFCALVDRPSGASAIGVVKGTFSGTTLTWGTPVIAREVDGVNKALDKQWLVADSLTGNLYLTYTLFTAFDDSVEFQRSTDGGATWGPILQLSSNAAAGLVQGSRPAVGPDGEVYAVWYEIGTIDQDFMRIRRSTDQGVSFGAEQTAAGFFSNFGSGAPGFNRERGLQFPSIAVDRTAGPDRGRVYVTYNESFNYFDDALTIVGARSEVENNNTTAGANLFTIGNTVRGAFGNTTDIDYFSFNAVAGQSYLFWCDSVPRPLYTMRILCGADGTTQLAYGADLFAPAGGQAFYVWTAPTTATHYLRMAYVAGGLTGGYRVRTSVMATGPEIGRDQRDIVIAYSDDAVSWNTARVNDDAALYDNWLPEVAVGSDGCPYVTWYDWRDHGCGGRSHMYASRSDDGGATWLANQRYSDAQTAWSTVATNLAPNQGDYIHMYPDDRYVRSVWADGRLGTPDVYEARLDTWFDFTSCPDDTAVTVSAGNPAQVDFPWTARNRNPLFANGYTAALADERGWTLPAGGPVGAASDSPFGGLFTITVPDTAASGVNTITLTLTNAKGTRTQTCSIAVTVTSGNVAVGDGAALDFALLPASPNPARGATRLAFTLPRAGDVRLTVYGLQGQRIRTLANGAFGAGLHTIAWDGKDDGGRPVPAGAYFARLEGLSRTANQRIVWMR
jgi:hypothetical protein